MDDSLGGAASLAFDILWQRGQHLCLRELALFRVIVTRDQRQVTFTVDVSGLAVRMPREVTRARSLGRIERAMRSERPLVRIEGIDNHLVQAQVTAQRKLVCLVDMDRMSVLLWTLVLLKRRCLAELSIRVDRNADAASARVVCGKDILSGRINDEVARCPTLRRS